MRLKPRVEALESRSAKWKPWHRIIVRVGDTVDAAKARYEAENGPLGDDACLIVRIMVRPQNREAVPCA